MVAGLQPVIGWTRPRRGVERATVAPYDNHRQRGQGHAKAYDETASCTPGNALSVHDSRC
ncbi:hypothetical protein ppKF707_5168 [Metapseudomonas furukawaii]|nr:hypothetical protein ppKF707_5168 [Pseudomonas furukawaii]